MTNKTGNLFLLSHFLFSFNLNLPLLQKGYLDLDQSLKFIVLPITLSPHPPIIILNNDKAYLPGHVLPYTFQKIS